MQWERKRKLLFNLSVLILYFLVFLFLYRSFIFGNRVMVRSDGSGYFAFKSYLSNCLKAGELPLWNPYIGIGNPFLADVQNAVFDPTNLLYLCMEPVLAFNISYILKLAFAAFFMFLLIKEMTGKLFLPVFAGIIYSFSGMLGGLRVEHVTIISTIVFFPLIMYFMEKYRKCLDIRPLLLSSLAMAIQFAVGFTQIVLYFDIVLFAYFIYIHVRQKVPFKKSIARCGIWIGFYLLLAAAQLLPLVKLMRNSLIGDRPWSGFVSLSCDLRVLLLMLFPDLLHNRYSPWASQASTGIDIELYVGIVSIVYILYLLIFYLKKDRQVQVYFGMGIGALLYAMLPQVPVINQILYRLPVLGSFRAAGRSATIFVFFIIVLLALGLGRLETKEDIEKAIKVNAGFIFSVSVILFVVWGFLSQDSVRKVMDDYYSTFAMRAGFVLLLPAVNLVCLCILYFLRSDKRWNVVFMGIVTLMIVMDTARYSVIKTGYEAESLTAPTADEHVLNTAVEDTQNGYRSFALSGSFNKNKRLDIYQYNKSSMLGLLSYNDYITFIDPKLGYWGIAETASYPATIQMVQNRNDLVSMMSIRHFVDDGDSGADIGSAVSEKSSEEVFEIEDQVFAGDGNVGAAAYEITGLEEDSIYKFSLRMETEGLPDVFYLDFYGDGYDNPEQDAVFPKVRMDGKKMTTFVTTEKLPEEKIYLRLIYVSDFDIKIKDLKVEKIEVEPLYTEISNKKGTKIYENPNAEKIVYAPSRLNDMESYGDSFLDTEMEHIDKENYIAGFGRTVDLSDTNTEISNIRIGYNYVMADVSADKDTFVNHSQLFTSDWKAYVDGNKVKLYNVNNLIQGVEIPEGRHVVAFRYEPWEVYAGMAISLIAICLFVLLYTKSGKRKEKKT